MDGGRDYNRTPRDGLRLLCGTVPGRDLQYPHASRKLVLHSQPHRALLPHFSHFLPGFLPPGGVRRQSEPGDDDSTRSGCVPVDGW